MRLLEPVQLYVVIHYIFSSFSYVIIYVEHVLLVDVSSLVEDKGIREHIPTKEEVQENRELGYVSDKDWEAYIGVGW